MSVLCHPDGRKTCDRCGRAVEDACGHDALTCAEGLAGEVERLRSVALELIEAEQQRDKAIRKGDQDWADMMTERNKAQQVARACYRHAVQGLSARALKALFDELGMNRSDAPDWLEEKQ